AYLPLLVPRLCPDGLAGPRLRFGRLLGRRLFGAPHLVRYRPRPRRPPHPQHGHHHDPPPRHRPAFYPRPRPRPPPLPHTGPPPPLPHPTPPLHHAAHQRRRHNGLRPRRGQQQRDHAGGQGHAPAGQPPV